MAAAVRPGGLGWSSPSPVDGSFTGDRSFPPLSPLESVGGETDLNSTRRNGTTDDVIATDPLDARAAADAIDAMLVRRADPVYRPLRTSLAATLQNRSRIETALKTFHNVFLGRGYGATYAFGSALAGAWADPERTAKDISISRDCVFDGLDRVQAARVRGLLTHLEWAVKADPNVTARDFFSTQDLVVVTKDKDSDSLTQSPVESTKLASPQSAVEEEEDEWPPAVFAREYRTPTTPAQRVLRLWQAIEQVHGSLAEGFKAMDVESRGYVSFGDFSAYLIRVSLTDADSEGSLQGMELFKLLDMDRDDLLSPKDVMRGFKAAERIIAELDRKRREEEETERQRKLHNLPSDIDRIPRARVGVAIDSQVRMAVLRRYLTARYGSFIAGLRRMDTEGDGFIYREDFVHALLSEGYCISVAEAEELFRMLDIGNFNALSLKHVEALDEHGLIPGGSESMDPESERMARRQMEGPAPPPPVGVGTGGLFSDPGPLDGAVSPRIVSSPIAQPTPRAEIAGRLHATPTQSWRSSHQVMVNPAKHTAEESPIIKDGINHLWEKDFPRQDVLLGKARASIDEAWVSFDVSAQKGRLEALEAASNAQAILRQTQAAFEDSGYGSGPGGSGYQGLSPSSAAPSLEQLAGDAFGAPLTPATRPGIPETNAMPVLVRAGEENQTVPEQGGDLPASRRERRSEIRRSLGQRNSFTGTAGTPSQANG